MPFVELSERLEAGEPDKLASIQLRVRGGGRPSCVVGIRKGAGELLKWKGGQTVGFAIGTGDEAGKARIAASAKGIAKVKALKINGAASIDFGYVAAFGSIAKIKTAINARVDGGALIIDLPNWDEIASPGDDDDEGDDADARPPHQRAAQQTSALYSPPPMVGRAPPPRTVDEVDQGAIENEGIKVVFNPPQVEHHGKKAQLSMMQARVLGPLVKTVGKILPLENLAKLTYGNKVQPGDLEAIRQAIGQMHVALAKADLKINIVKGMGYSLVKF